MKKCRSAFNNSKAGLTQLDNNQPHHITADTPQGEKIVSKQTSALHVDCHQSSDANPPNIISSYTRSSRDNSEWSAGAIYMDASMTSTSSQKKTSKKVPIDQVAITIADLTLSGMLKTKEDWDNLYIFHDHKKRTTLFSKEEDGLSGHLFLISSGRAKAAATPITTRISCYSIMVQIYRDLCEQAGVLSRFSRHINIDPMRMARAEDKRQLARKEPNESCNKKLKVLERKQLDESTLLLNSTLKTISWTRMDDKSRDDIDMEMYPSSSIEERDERRRVEQKKKEEQVEQVKQLQELKAKKRLEKERDMELNIQAKAEKDRAAPKGQKPVNAALEALLGIDVDLVKHQAALQREEAKKREQEARKHHSYTFEVPRGISTGMAFDVLIERQRMTVICPSNVIEGMCLPILLSQRATQQQHYTVDVPQGISAGMLFNVLIEGERMPIICPSKVQASMKLPIVLIPKRLLCAEETAKIELEREAGEKRKRKQAALELQDQREEDEKAKKRSYEETHSRWAKAEKDRAALIVPKKAKVVDKSLEALLGVGVIQDDIGDGEAYKKCTAKLREKDTVEGKKRPVNGNESTLTGSQLILQKAKELAAEQQAKPKKIVGFNTDRTKVTIRGATGYTTEVDINKITPNDVPKVYLDA